MMASGLWTDGWFYISAAGLLVSGVLFFFLLSQYRVAGEAADEPESEPSALDGAPETPAEPAAAALVVEEPVRAPLVASAVVAESGRAAPDVAELADLLKDIKEQLGALRNGLSDLTRAVAELKSEPKPETQPLPKAAAAPPLAVAPPPAAAPLAEPELAEKPRRGPVWPV